MNVQTTVSYNRSSRKWEARRGGTTVEFPAGKAGKRSALELKLRADAPSVWTYLTRLLDNHGDNSAIVTRSWKAADLATDRYVLHQYCDLDDEVTRVASKSQPRAYAVRNLKSGGYRCDCPDWQYGRQQQMMSEDDPDWPPYGAPSINGHLYCKHILAHILVLNAGIEPRDYAPNAQEMADKVWQSALDRLCPLAPLERVESLKHIRGVRLGRGELIIRAPSVSTAEWIRGHFLNQVEEAVNRVSSETLTINITSLED